MSAPLTYRWSGDAMEPIPRHRDVANATFVVGEMYRMVEYHDRSLATHNHEFAWLHEAWKNLPEDLADSYPTAEHLRKRALIEGGFFDEMAIDAGTNAAAIRVASAFRAIDDFALVIVRGGFVIRRTAKSQSRRAMNKQEFQASKEAVLQVVSEMIGVRPEDLQRESGRAA